MTRPSRKRSSKASWPASAAPTWITAASTIASGRRWSVPPKLDLPPPDSASSEMKDPNWPKDPDEARRKAAIAARKKENKDPVEAGRVLTPSELNAGQDGRTGRTTAIRVAAWRIPAPMRSSAPPNSVLTASSSSIFGGSKAEVGSVQGRADAGIPDPASRRIPDAVAEFRLRHRAEGIAEQGIQPGRRTSMATKSHVRSLGFVTPTREPRGVRCRGFIPNASVRASKQVMMPSHRFAVSLFAALLSALRFLRKLRPRPDHGHLGSSRDIYPRQRPAGGGDPGSPHARSSRR